MKTKYKSIIHTARHLLGAVCVGIAFLISNSAQAQNLFVADGWSGNIYEYTPGGVRSVFASGLNSPNGLAFNSFGDLFVAENGNLARGIIEFPPGGKEILFASDLKSPVTGLAINSAGDLFATFLFNNNIYEFAPNGVQTTFATGLGIPVGLAFDSAGNLFVCVQGPPPFRIIKITPGGVQSTFATGIFGEALAFNNAGDLFASDGSSGNIYEYTPGGVRSTFATGIFAEGLAFDSAGDLFASDYDGTIYKITPSGQVSTFATGLHLPGAMAFQPVPKPSAFTFNAFVNAVSISTNRAGNLVYRRFGNRNLIRDCVNQMGVTNLMGLHLVYDLNNDALEVVRGYSTNQTLVCTPLTFSGGVFLGNANASRSERQAWVYWDGQTSPSGTLNATERYGYGPSNQLTRFSLSGQLQFALPGGGTNNPTIYQGNVKAGSRFFVPVIPHQSFHGHSNVGAEQPGLHEK